MDKTVFKKKKWKNIAAFCLLAMYVNVEKRVGSNTDFWMAPDKIGLGFVMCFPNLIWNVLLEKFDSIWFREWDRCYYAISCQSA